MQKIEFYFDFLSPYSYLAWTRVREMDELFEYYPVSIPNIVAHYETKGPGQIRPKRDFLARDLLRYKTIHQIPFKFPPNVPFNSLYALRLSLIEVSGSNQKKIIDLFFRAAWEYGFDLGESELIEKILNDNNFKTSQMMDQIATKEVKLLLRSNIDRALKKDVFGVPTFIVKNAELDKNVGDELFWGNDSIKYLEMYLKGNDPLPREEYQKLLTQFSI